MLHTSTYNKGYDRDSSKNKYPQGSYFKLKNMRITSFEQLSNGAIQSMKGNIIAITAPGGSYSAHIVIGIKIIRNYVVAWSTDNNTTTGGTGVIWRADLSSVSPGWTKVYESTTMYLSAMYPIADEAVGYYESADIINVYWTDFFNMIRHINIGGSAFPLGISVDQLDILPCTTFTAPTLLNIGGGHIYVGMIQYALQYFNIGGVETSFSPCTKLIHLTDSSEFLSGTNIRLYKGSLSLDDSGAPKDSGKSVTLQLGGLDSNFDKVRLVAIHYANINQTPTVYVVGEYDAVNNMIVTDYGNYTLGTITLNTLRTLGNPYLKCKTLAQKGNKMLVGNTKEQFFDITFDARAYRNKPVHQVPTDLPGIVVYNSKDNIEEWITQTGVWPNAVFTIGGDPVPEDHDCINPYNYDFLYGAVIGPVNPQIDEVATYAGVLDFAINPLTGEENNANGYKWQSDLVTLGGEGANVKYEFLTQLLVTNDNSNNNARIVQPANTTIGNLTSYDSFKNPFVEATYKSLKHDEVYRCGIVFRNTRGQFSFVKWIGDIKTPTVSEFKIARQPVGAQRTTYLYDLGIKFTVNTTGLAAQGVAGFQIVIVERTAEDRSILTQGVASCMFYDDRGVAHDYEQTIVGYPRATIKSPTEGTDASYYKIQADVVQFISPEINFMKNISPKSGDYIKANSKLSHRVSWLSTAPWTPANTFDTYGEDERTEGIDASDFPTLYNSRHWFNFSRYIHTAALTELLTYNILEGVFAGTVESGAHDENKIVLASSPSGLPILNRSVDYDPSTNVTDHEGISGSCLILILDDTIDDSELVGTDELELFLFDYKRPGICAAQYGGLSYEARKNNTYIAYGPYIAVTTGAQDAYCYGGDIFLGFHEHLKTAWEVDDNDGGGTVDITYLHRFFAMLAFPCESIINLDLDHGYKYSRNYSDSLYAYSHALREVAGNWSGDYIDHAMPDTDYDLIQDEDMYQYNTVFSQQDNTMLFFPQPVGFESLIAEDTLTKISLEKVPREDVDSFLKFLTDNEKVLPTQFGALNKLFEFKNYIIAFFDDAIGTLSVDERAVLPIQNNAIMELGSSENLKYFDFIANRSGSIHPQSISESDTGFIWFDAHRGMVGYYNGSTLDIGLVKGISSDIMTYSALIKSVAGSYYNNPFAGGNVLSKYNPKYKETLCSFTVSELAAYKTKDGTSVSFDLIRSPGNYSDAKVIINEVEYIAHSITGVLGVGVLTINVTDNPTLVPGDAIWAAGWFHIYYKDLSIVFSYSDINNAFILEADIFPTWLLTYREDIYDVFGKFTTYRENNGMYGHFYGSYRKGEMEYIINPKGSIVCLFNNYEYAMEAFVSGENSISETWDTVRMLNDYQWSAGTGVSCTFTVTSNIVTINAHGFTIGDEIMFSGAALPATVLNTKKYFVINVTANTFQITETMNGTPIALTTTTGLCHALDVPIVVTGSTINNRRRFRTWRLKDLRDMKGYVAGVFKPRMRDTYLRLTFKYNHADNKRIIMHDLNVFYTPTREALGNY